MMNRFLITLVIVAALLCQTSSPLAASSERLSKSVVKVIVKTDSKTNYGTGFVWKNANHVVTSLHVMRPRASIIVEYKGEKFQANVVKVLRKADLVLLETATPIRDATALSDYDGAKPAEDTHLKALGFNEDARKFSSRLMIKGFVDPPETLNSLIPSEDRKSIGNAGMPALDLAIYYTNMGSLLHGYSGAPVFNSQTGGFIGIGDGGLENGASDVSWIIPAPYLDELITTGEDVLPSDLETISQHFSAETNAPDYREVRAVTSPLFSDSTEEWSLVFVLNKTRNFADLLNEQEKTTLLQDLNYFVPASLDIDSFEFDIYEEQATGIVIALPKGVALLPDDEVKELKADYADTSAFNINYWLEAIEFEPTEANLNLLADEYIDFIRESNEQLNEDEEAADYVEVDRYLIDHGDGKYTLRVAFQDSTEGWIEYLTLAANERAGLVLFVQAELWLDDLDYNEVANCWQKSTDACDEYREMATIISATQLTTFANQVQTQ